MTFGSLFAGIGGMDLGLERAGMKCVWQVEIDDYANRVLEKHWPKVKRHRDVRDFPPSDADEWRVDCIAGGFPCQDISTANPGRSGLAGERSGLWSEFRRIIRLLRPRVVIVENVSHLLVLGLDQVLADLAECGFDAEWSTFSAAQFGAPQFRRRVFIVAYPMRERRPLVLRGQLGTLPKEAPWGEWQSCSLDSPCGVLQAVEQSVGESSVLRSGDGIHAGMDRLGVIGNAVVPQVAEWIGRRIMESIQ